MEIQRYFGDIIDNQAILSEDDVFHCTRVMRMRPGDKLELVCDKQVFIGEVITLKPFRVDIVSRSKEQRELPAEVILVASLLKGDKIELVLQKATELGASEVVLLNAQRCVVKIKESQKEGKFNRYNRILKEAAEQSKRTTLPICDRLINVKDLDTIKADVKLIAYEENAGDTKVFFEELKKVRKGGRIVVVIGPEGGFTRDEVRYAKAKGYVPISLGRRILRAETASMYALSVIAGMLERK